jgi:hypothetical protein
MKRIFLLTTSLLVISCVPYKIAPNIEDYKIVKAKRFKRDLPERYAFVFEDDGEEDAFRHFAGNKFALGHENPASDVPFEVNGSTYFMSIHEREKTTETVNFLPLLIDGFLSSEGHDPILEESYATGNSYWYIVITVVDSDFKDCLAPTFANQMDVILYLRLLKLEYQGNQNYTGAYLKK